MDRSGGALLGSLRRRIEALMLPDDPVITLSLGRTARLERDRRHGQATEKARRRWSCRRQCAVCHRVYQASNGQPPLHGRD
jgi:hypothetical protein